MNAQRWAEVCRLFDAASEISPPERDAFLERECGGDRELRSEVESLLARDGGTSFLDEPRTSGPARRHVGPYELGAEIGRGGMGVVYEAVRKDQGFERAVAVKLVKRGMDTDFILRRFQGERRILGELDHPNIARVLDGGETSDGIPYFVMELIRGKHLLEYCEEKRLDTAGRLALFRQVCAAITYAHQRLVIHRDIKPANILVTEEGVPKLLDFGIAKLLAGEDGAPSDRTETALRVLTPEYASPEQVLGKEITTSSDVYSLGVVLYELLAGQRPYRLTTGAPEEVRSAVVGQEPEKPSTKARLHRDLDHIVMMALRKEPERRYASAEQLSEDIRRYLEGLPVKATPDSFGYRAGKFARRHKAGVATFALAAVSLLVGLALALWQMRVAQQERVRAEGHLAEVRKLATSFLFEHHNAVKDLAGSTPAQKLLVERGVTYLDLLSKEAGGDPTFRSELAEAYQKLGNLQGGMGNEAYLGQTQAALESYRKSLALREGLPGKDLKARTALAQTHLAMGQLVMKMGKRSEALEHYRKAVSIRERLTAESPADADRKNDLGVAYHFLASGLFEAGDERGEIEAYRKEAALFAQVVALKPGERKPRRNLGLAYQHLGGNFSRSSLLLPPQPGEDLPAAAETLEKASALQVALCAEDPGNATYKKDLSSTYAELGHALHRSGDHRRAVESFRACLRIREGLAAADPGDMTIRHLLASVQTRLGYDLTLVGSHGEGIEQCRRALAHAEAVARADPKNVFRRAGVAEALYGLGLSLRESGSAARGAGGVALLREARATLLRGREIYLGLKSAGELPSQHAEHLEELTSLLKADEEASGMARTLLK